MHMNRRMYACMYVYIQISVYTHMYAYIYVYTNICTAIIRMRAWGGCRFPGICRRAAQLPGPEPSKLRCAFEARPQPDGIIGSQDPRHACTEMHTQTYLHNTHIYIYIYICMYMHQYIYVHVYTHLHIGMYVHV